MLPTQNLTAFTTRHAPTRCCGTARPPRGDLGRARPSPASVSSSERGGGGKEKGPGDPHAMFKGQGPHPSSWTSCPAGTHGFPPHGFCTLVWKVWARRHGPRKLSSAQDLGRKIHDIPPVEEPRKAGWRRRGAGQKTRPGGGCPSSHAHSAGCHLSGGGGGCRSFLWL